MRQTNTLIFLSITLKQTIAGPRGSGTPFLILLWIIDKCRTPSIDLYF